MQIEHQGWNDTVGVFHCDVTIDEHRNDYEIRFSDGCVFHQQSAFKTLSSGLSHSDVNSDCFGAFFVCGESREFFTPLELASLVLNGYAIISPELQIEEHQENLADRIAAASRLAKEFSEPHPDAPSHCLIAPVR